MEDLYVEVLGGLLHSADCLKNEDNIELKTFPYLQETFGFSQEHHNELLDKAREKKSPKLELNVDIIEVNFLNAKGE